MLRYPEMRVGLACLVCSVWVFGSGCTFYTACPTGGTASTGASGGSANGGGAGSGPSPILTDPAPAGDWKNVTPDLTMIMETCGPLFSLTSKPSEDLVIAGVTNNGLWATSDGGTSWRVLGQGTDSEPVIQGTNAIIFDPSPANSDVFWPVGIRGRAVFRTDDDGVTFKHLGDSMSADYLSVDFSDSQRKTLLTSGHEMQQLSRSEDGGDTWTDITAAIPSGLKVCSYPYILDSMNYLLGCGGGSDQGQSAILRSSDAGTSWTTVFDKSGATAPLLTSDGTIYWAQELGGGLARSDDQGQTFTSLVPANTLLTVSPIELPDKRIASMTSQNIVVSDDQGKTWKLSSANMPYVPSGFTYSEYQRAFFIWYFKCSATGAPMPGPTDGIMRFDFDYETQ
jgi:photosystem II stability/assembly factor-like uncharacterized protein